MLTASIIREMMEAVSTSETLLNFYKTTWHNIPEDSLLQPFVTFKSTSYTYGIKVLKVCVGKGRQNSTQMTATHAIVNSLTY
jgi:hypothetical protein